MALQQILADQEAQHGVAQKLELFVVARSGLPLREGLLVNVRTMRQRAAKDLPVREPVARGDLQGVQIRAHDGATASGLPVLAALGWRAAARRLVWAGSSSGTRAPARPAQSA